MKKIILDSMVIEKPNPKHGKQIDKSKADTS